MEEMKFFGSVTVNIANVFWEWAHAIPSIKNYQR